MCKMKITIVTHYQRDEGCDGDYRDIEVFFDEVKVLELGDYYHDKGAEQVVGGLKFLRAAGIDYETERIEVADREW